MSNCYRCDAVIPEGQGSRRNEKVRRIVSSEGKRETHYSKELICRDCMNSIWARKVWFAILCVVVFGSVFGWYELSARSPETVYRDPGRSQASTVYQNPDFPCVRAINPTVTDPDCLTAIARRP